MISSHSPPQNFWPLSKSWAFGKHTIFWKKRQVCRAFELDCQNPPPCGRNMAIAKRAVDNVIRNLGSCPLHGGVYESPKILEKVMKNRGIVIESPILSTKPSLGPQHHWWKNSKATCKSFTCCDQPGTWQSFLLPYIGFMSPSLDSWVHRWIHESIPFSGTFHSQHGSHEFQWFQGTVPAMQLVFGHSLRSRSQTLGFFSPDFLGKKNGRLVFIPSMHVWHIYRHLVDFYGKCRYCKYAIHGCYGV